MSYIPKSVKLYDLDTRVISAWSSLNVKSDRDRLNIDFIKKRPTMVWPQTKIRY